MMEEKTFNVRLPKELWTFLKKKSMQEEISMAKIIHKSISRMKKKDDKKKLTKNDADV